MQMGHNVCLYLRVEKPVKKDVMPRAFSYVVKRDYGFAPNPFYGILTLATCKPLIRRGASVGDFIIGNADASHENKLIYMAKVSEVITFDQYWNDPRFECKKPVMNGSLKKLYGDNIYHHGTDGNWVQEDSHHSNNDGTVNIHNLERDTGKTDHVLVCYEYIYLGRSMIKVPEEYENCIHKGRNHHCPSFPEAQRLWDYLITLYPKGGKIDQPNKFIKFERYGGLA